jgi:hypothetical protein
MPCSPQRPALKTHKYQLLHLHRLTNAGPPLQDRVRAIEPLLAQWSLIGSIASAAAALPMK